MIVVVFGMLVQSHVTEGVHFLVPIYFSSEAAHWGTDVRRRKAPEV